ncbi:MAG: MotA/TolQ/ExbB proton channel family protein [Bacteroidia bacterium]|nr:MotA/TolQ/ExbB proton channel family protein [Bacteroidia bacterium]
MLTSTFYSLHIEGGPPFMFPLLLLFVINIGIFIYILISLIQKKQFNPKWLEAIKQIGGLAAAYGTFGTLIGLFFAFDALEEMEEMIPLQVIMGGLKVALVTVLYGLIIFCLSLLAYIILKLASRNSPA